MAGDAAARFKVGDQVRIMECRPLSKTVAFCVIERGDAE